jgi:glutamate:GABA antiporter
MDVGKHGLARELKLRDLVPMQVVIIVWLGWTGFAAKQGSTQVVLWLLAILLFYLPLAAVVMKLSRSLPVEGGVYQWVKAGLSPFAGYMAAWNFSIYVVCTFAVAGSFFANGLAHALGPRAAWMYTSGPLAFSFTAAACLVAFILNARGLHFAKWWSDAGALLMVATFLMLAALLARAWWIGLPTSHASFSLALPAFSLLTLNVFTKMAISALSGFDGAAIFSEECRKPENDVAKSVVIAAPLIALAYILGTSSVLAYIRPSNVDLAAAVPQVMEAGLGTAGWRGWLNLAGSAAFNLSFLASIIVYIGLVARLPMVAGWDGLLPGWWSELHPKFKTPTKAIAVVAIAIALLGALSLWGAGNQEAIQVGVGAAFGSFSITYMLLFGVILFGFRSGAIRAGLGLRLGALAAFLVALCNLLFEAVPLGDVENGARFALKVAGTICALNVLGAFLYWRGTKRAVKMAVTADAVAPLRDA